MDNFLHGLTYALIYIWAVGGIVTLVIFAYSEGRSDASTLDFHGRGLGAAPIVAIFWPFIVGGKAFDIIAKNLKRNRKA